MLIAIGVDLAGRKAPSARCLSGHLGARSSLALILQILLPRGLCGVRLVTSDAHPGIQCAVRSVLGRTVQKYEKSAPKLADWMEQNRPEGLTVFVFPVSHRRLLRTTNGLERVNRELRRRTRVASIFPNEASCLRLVTALLMEISDDWQSDKAYLTLKNE